MQRMEAHAAIMDVEVARWGTQGYLVERGDGLMVIVGTRTGSRVQIRVAGNGWILTQLLSGESPLH